MKRVTITILLLAFLMGMTGPVGAQDPVKPDKKDKCPVCGMFVYKYPDWVAQIIYKDNTVEFFDGAKDMLKYYHNLDHYAPNRTLNDIAKIYVTDYYDLELIDAKNAFYVVGSDVYGPMGKELVPLATREDAEGFKADHQGKDIIMMDDVTKDLLKTLD